MSAISNICYLDCADFYIYQIYLLYLVRLNIRTIFHWPLLQHTFLRKPSDGTRKIIQTSCKNLPFFSLFPAQPFSSRTVAKIIVKLVENYPDDRQKQETFQSFLEKKWRAQIIFFLVANYKPVCMPLPRFSWRDILPYLNG